MLKQIGPDADRGNFAQDEGSFAQVRCKISSIARGGGGGFMTYVAFAPGRDAGVFVAVNRVNFAMFMGLASAANQVLDSLVTR